MGVGFDGLTGKGGSWSAAKESIANMKMAGKQFITEFGSRSKFIEFKTQIVKFMPGAEKAEVNIVVKQLVQNADDFRAQPFTAKEFHNTRTIMSNKDGTNEVFEYSSRGRAEILKQELKAEIEHFDKWQAERAPLKESWEQSKAEFKIMGKDLRTAMDERAALEKSLKTETNLDLDATRQAIEAKQQQIDAMKAANAEKKAEIANWKTRLAEHDAIKPPKPVC